MKAVIKRIEDLLLANGVANVVISGMTCSGKTTLANHIKDVFSGKYTVSILSQDDYFKNLEAIPKSNVGYHMDSTEAFYAEDFVHDSIIFFSGGSVIAPIYDIVNNKRVVGRGKVIYGANVNIVEGLHAIGLLHDKWTMNGGKKHFENVFLEVDPKVCLRRRIERDTQKYNVPEWIIQQAWNECIIPLSEKYILPQKKYADTIISSKGGDIIEA